MVYKTKTGTNLCGEEVGGSEKGEAELLLAEGGDAGVGRAVVAASHRQADHQEHGDRGGQVEAQDDHGRLTT